MTRRRPPKPRPGGLGEDLERLAQADPKVREASDRVDWVAQKAAMGWPEPVRVRKSSPPSEPPSEPATVPADVRGALLAAADAIDARAQGAGRLIRNPGKERLCNSGEHDDRSCTVCGHMEDGMYLAAEMLRAMATTTTTVGPPEDLVAAIRAVLGAAGIYRGYPGLPAAELWRRLWRDHEAVAGQHLAELGVDGLVREVLDPLTSAGILAIDPEERSVAGPRWLLPTADQADAEVDRTTLRFQITAENDSDGNPPFVVDGVASNTVIANGENELNYWLREFDEDGINVSWRRLNPS